MDDKDLHTLLTELHAELQKTEAVDDKESELLRHLEGDIKALLERSGEEAESGPEVAASLEESVGQFELTHPTLTAQIYKILELLSGSGI